MRVIKSSGETERFSSRKIYRGVLRAGGSRKLARATVDYLKKRRTVEKEDIISLISYTVDVDGNVILNKEI